MDRSTIVYNYSAFKMAIPIMPGFPVLKKSLADLGVKIPKAVREATGQESLLEAFNKHQQANTWADCQDALTKWVDRALEWVNQASDDQLETKRGIDVSTVVVTLFGKEATVPVAAGILLKGCELQKLLVSEKLEMSEQEFKDLNKVLNFIRASCADLIPSEYKEKRTRKEKSSEGPNESTETTENDSEDNEE